MLRGFLTFSSIWRAKFRKMDRYKHRYQTSRHEIPAYAWLKDHQKQNLLEPENSQETSSHLTVIIKTEIFVYNLLLWTSNQSRIDPYVSRFSGIK